MGHEEVILRVLVEKHTLIRDGVDTQRFSEVEFKKLLQVSKVF